MNLPQHTEPQGETEVRVLYQLLLDSRNRRSN